MKEVLLIVLKVIGIIFYLFVALVIGVGFSPIAGWVMAIAGIVFLVIRHYKKKKIDATKSIEETGFQNSSKDENNTKEGTSSKTTKKVISEKVKDDKSVQPIALKKDDSASTSSSAQTHTKMAFSDLFKAKQFKLELENLKQDQKALEEKKAQLEQDNAKLQKEADLKLSIKQMQPIELDKEITAKTQELDDIVSSKQKDIEKLNNDIDQKNQKVAEKDKQISDLDKKIKDLNDQLVNVSDEVMYEDYGLYKPRYDFANSSAYKGKLSEVRSNQKEMIRDGEAGTIFNPMLLDNSKAKGRSMQKKNIKQLVRSFNGECEAAINKVTKSNIEMIEKRITRSFEQLNKLNEPNGVRLTANYLDSKLDEAHIALEYALKKEQEKELLREQRQREKEERQAQKEYAQERAKYEKDETHFQQAKDLLQEKINNSKSDVEIESLKRKLADLQDKLSNIQAKKAKLSDRAENPTAGYVYIISNIGSFGQNVYKIGVTRRLDPMDRINELSSASVPFKFDVHALIFTDDAYKLETELHEYFDKKRVNKVNKRKEFFRLNIDEIKEILSKHKELTFDFHEIPDAPEYRDTLLIEKQMQSQKKA
jgi:chromosome segregation ATPase